MDLVQLSCLVQFNCIVRAILDQLASKLPLWYDFGLKIAVTMVTVTVDVFSYGIISGESRETKERFDSARRLAVFRCVQIFRGNWRHNFLRRGAMRFREH